MKFISLLLFLSLVLPVAAQTESNVWYFGYGAGLDFNGSTVQTISDGALHSNEGVASVSDCRGEILFYTNGVTVWDKSHQPMPNGQNLFGHESSTQSAIIVPKPNAPNIYYIFTTAAIESSAAGLCYSEVDISLNGGLGDVTQNKNVQLLTPICEKVTAVLHENKVDIWVIVHSFGSNAFHSYLVTTDGVDPNSTVSFSGSSINVSNHRSGFMKSSPNGKYLALANGKLGNAELFHFDDATGVVDTPQIVKSDFIGQGAYGVEFSPSSEVLYVVENTTPPVIYQFDLTANNIPASALVIGIPSATLGLQLGPDGVIYCAEIGDPSVGAILNPDVVGAGCDYHESYIQLNHTCMFGFPPLIISSDFLSALELTIPNVFTPNDDGINDVYLLPKQFESTFSAIEIFNRWGQQVFYSDDISNGWDGRVGNSKAAEGVYYFVIKGVQQDCYSGSEFNGFLYLRR